MPISNDDCIFSAWFLYRFKILGIRIRRLVFSVEVPRVAPDAASRLFKWFGFVLDIFNAEVSSYFHIFAKFLISFLDFGMGCLAEHIALFGTVRLSRSG